MTEDPPPSTPPRRKVDATSLQGLAHPLRVQLLDQLILRGPATATHLAKRLGESSGATSYHLRQLEKFGFVEEDLERGAGRERWWRRVPGGITIEGGALQDRPATRDATNVVLNEVNRLRQARIDKFRATYQEWPEEWQKGSTEMSNHLRLTADELRELVDDVDQLLTAWDERTRDREGDGFVDVEVQTYAMPVGDPPAEPAQPSS